MSAPQGQPEPLGPGPPRSPADGPHRYHAVDDTPRWLATRCSWREVFRVLGPRPAP